MSQGSRVAFATLVTNADYALGALALVRSLALTKSTADVVVLATPNGLTHAHDLERAGALIVAVEQPLFSSAFCERHARDTLHAKSPFGKGRKPQFHDPLDNFCKLRLWQLTQYERVIFLDADTVVIRNIDHLFGYPQFCGAPNLYESLEDMHRLNSGVFVAQPDANTFDRMVTALDAPEAYWPRTDQTFLQDWFPRWHGLPYIYNTLQYVYFNLPQLWHWPAIHVVHYQYEKPWESDHPKRQQLGPLIDLWHQLLEGRHPPEELPVARI